MDTTSPPPSSPNDSLMASLRSSFVVFRETRPLAIGIHKAIVARLPEVGNEQLKSAMRRHTGSTAYLKALATSTVRYDLDGNPAGEVSAEQQQQAATLLKERFRKGAERRRQELQEKERLSQLARQEREKQEKLQQLAQKFARR